MDYIVIQILDGTMIDRKKHSRLRLMIGAS